MSNKPGRNAQCPCGSGKKYKRCCLAADETAARERVRQQVLFADELTDDFESDDDESFVMEDDAPLLDLQAIVRVCYTRGLVEKLSDLRAGRDVRVTEWSAPHIPHAVLTSLEREAVDALEGEWGDPKSGNPIQIDIIDLETDDDVVTIQVFNRAICLIHDNSEEMRRIHRVCHALESATGRDKPADTHELAAAAATLQGHETEPAVVDVAAVVKQHRRQRGTCALCGEGLTRQGARKHFASCVPAHDLTGGSEDELVHVRVTAPGLPAYWLDLEIKAHAKLDALDSFLRRTWLECCGHLSAFEIGSVKYFSRGYDLGLTQAYGSFGQRRISERSMSARVGDAFPAIGDHFEYEYDFGSTTTLQLAVVGERTGSIGRAVARLLARNSAPLWPCATCGQPATSVCAYCLGDEVSAFACDAHVSQHRCGDTEGFLPVVNSPRMGVCGYGVET